ncbi:uncharacterized protein AMSG_04302 [Thecamonas trahens ATCC 50062]|uniref:Uncharacterized protein n=1 Tax=Thecamonas trahens ATCC 50062 TaxID=461836 RepID=A0A0L0D7P2_THETB|nr:hypothetical protein AMSG_04302 [Thecamonas trahens ATCC 50062]KNC48071.1 hypothetical protein AMSG_04302 [Thecamonas trahens ATCC 50062]|eukprot:XP_013759086.1 hypothetical protein AMSG_04302 [Thecamonas trahens ATCC 50062]
MPSMEALMAKIAGSSEMPGSREAEGAAPRRAQVDEWQYAGSSRGEQLALAEADARIVAAGIDALYLHTAPPLGPRAEVVRATIAGRRIKSLCAVDALAVETVTAGSAAPQPVSGGVDRAAVAHLLDGVELSAQAQAFRSMVEQQEAVVGRVPQPCPRR